MVLIFLIPGVQTYTAKKLTDNINNEYNTQISIDRVKIGINAKISLTNALVLDHRNDTLIDVQSLSTSIFNLSNLISKGNLDLSSTDIQDLKFNMVRYKGEDANNLKQLLKKFESQNKKDDSKEDFQLHIDDIFLINSEVNIIDYNLNTPEAFSISKLNMDLENINIVGSDISIIVNSLSGQTGYGFEIENLTTVFLMNSNEMKLNQLELITPHSELKTDLLFSFNSGDWADFENKVKIEADFDNSLISTTDLKYFYDEFGLSERLSVSGKMKGILNDFDLNNAEITGIQRSRISGDINFKQVTNGNKFSLDTKNFDITTNYFDLRRLLPDILGDNLPNFIKHMGSFNLKGKTYLKGTDINADMMLNSSVGSGKVELDFKDLELQNEVAYEGYLDLKNLNLGKLSQSTLLGLSSFNVYISGKGFTAESLDTEVEGKINNININNYTYKDVSIDGNLKYPLFDGKLESLDPNLLLDFDGLVDASQDINVYEFKSNIRYADLYKLNLLRKDTLSIFKGDLSFNVRGNTIDDAVGQINFTDFNYQNSFDKYNFDDFVIESKYIGETKQITINSPDVISGQLNGNFKLTELLDFVDVSIRNLYFKNIVEQKFQDKSINFEFQINNKVVEAFFPSLSIKPNTFLNGNISSNEDEIKIRFKTPEMRYQENVFQDVEIQVDKQNPFFDTYIEIANFQNSVYPIKNLNLINVRLNDTLFFRTEFDGGEQNRDTYNFNFYQTYDESDNTVVGIQKSDLRFKEKKWTIDNDKYGNNRILLESGLQNFIFDSLVFTHQDQSIKLNGVIRDSTFKDINLKLKKVELNNITPYIDSLDIKGLVNGNVNIYQKKGNYAPNMDVSIDGFSVNTFNYGNMKLSANGNKDLSDFNVKARLSDQQNEYLVANGVIKSRNQVQTIDLDAKLNNLDISSLSPLGADVISRLRGKLSGEAKLYGNLNNPNMSGEIKMKDAGLKFPYLNVDFDFKENSKISLEDKKFIFEDIQLTDTKYETESILSGFISHEQFSKWNLNLNLQADNTLTLDTSYDEESLYYGTAFISGNASITGPTDALVIDVNARSQPNTVFNIPLSDTETIGDNSFIYFLSPEDKKNKAEGKNYTFEEISGLTLTFDLDITEDALIEVVIDQESGSALKGRGFGNLRLEINTNGKFDMYGDFNAISGEYLYKYQGLIEKRFEVVPGGYISWDGNPIDANIDIEAKYRTDANPAVLLENPTINREIPIDVLINLRGQLMQPDIRFDLEYPNLSSIVESELDYRLQGRENLERQALSLVVQGTFFNDENAGINNLQSNLIAERATSILDQILRDEDGKFNIGFDYVQAERTPNQNAIGSDRVGMTLQTQLSDKIFINGRFGVPVGGATQSFVFGDVEVNFLLNKSGSLRAQMFNRESNIQFIGEELGYAQGIGILYAVDFETFGELLRKMTGQNPKVSTKNDSSEDKEPQESLVPSYIILPHEQ